MSQGHLLAFLIDITSVTKKEYFKFYND